MLEANDLDPAKVAAETVRQRIVACIDARQPFLVEAGAGAGKTYSLIDALKYLIKSQGRELLRRNQRVACITYTNVATEEIKARTDRHPAIQAETIHSFCWSAIRPFQSALRAALPTLERWPERLEDGSGLGERAVDYSLGYPSIEVDRVFLHHDDVLALTVVLLNQPKFRRLLSDRFPVILIDEYQDTRGDFASALLTHFVATGTGPVIGFFGDHWQKIYGEGCGRIEHAKLEVIYKASNFRSVRAVVDVLNRLRPELSQVVANSNVDGSATVYHTNAWNGQRLAGQHTKGDLPPEFSHQYLGVLKAKLMEQGWDFTPSITKILMLTHKGLAAEMGYRELCDAFPRNDLLIKKEDPHIAFLVDIIERVCVAYDAGRYGEMFAVLGEKRPTISSKDDKMAWARDVEKLLELRAGSTIGMVMDFLKNSRFQIPKAVQRREDLLVSNDPEHTDANTRLSRIHAVPFRQIAALTGFIDGNTPFDTKHGVKGAEFENVLVTLGRGWNRYNFDKMLELIGTTVSADQAEFFERNRNLFYVTCSRAKRRLALLFTQELSSRALNTLRNLFGEDSIHALPPMQT
jgi:DNA helicase-2/ATP-dependent DNA helicase PcrA